MACPLPIRCEATCGCTLFSLFPVVSACWIWSVFHCSYGIFWFSDKRCPSTLSVCVPVAGAIAWTVENHGSFPLPHEHTAPWLFSPTTACIFNVLLLFTGITAFLLFFGNTQPWFLSYQPLLLPFLPMAATVLSCPAGQIADGVPILLLPAW